MLQKKSKIQVNSQPTKFEAFDRQANLCHKTQLILQQKTIFIIKHYTSFHINNESCHIFCTNHFARKIVGQPSNLCQRKREREAVCLGNTPPVFPMLSQRIRRVFKLVIRY